MMTLKEFIKKHSYKYCKNEHPSDTTYLHPKMNGFAKQARERGEKFFYTEGTSKDLRLAEPKYMIYIETELTLEEYEELMNEKN